MKYQNRILEKKIIEAFSYFPAIALLGARQVGKSTLIKNLFKDSIRTVVFDPVQDIGNARNDPDFFLQNNPPPLFLDEIQYAPEVLPALKRRIDEEGRNGLYILSGSQNLSVLRNISESLAGRVFIQHLMPMSIREIDETLEDVSFLHEWVISSTWKKPQEIRFNTYPASTTLLQKIWRGGHPALLSFPDHMIPNYWQSYMQTYIERDVRTVANIGSLQTFGSFFGILSALSSQEINFSELGRELGIDRKTAQQWTEIAQATYQWITIPAFSRNFIKKASAKQKGYCTDTGFTCYLQRISTPDALANHPFIGRLMETFIVTEILKQCEGWALKPNVYHYRLHSGGEVDLILEMDGVLFPIEIKLKSHPTPADCKGFSSLRSSFPSEQFANNLIISNSEKPAMLTPDTLAVSWRNL